LAGSWTGGTGAGTRHSLSTNSNEAKASKNNSTGGSSKKPSAPPPDGVTPNFSQSDGQEAQVTYNQVSGPRPIYRNGVTTTLAQQGVFGKEDGFTRTSRDPTIPEPRKFSPAYGYSTNQGDVAYVYPSNANRSKRTPSFSEQRTADQAELRSALETYNQNPRRAAVAFLKPAVTVPGGFVERGSQRAQYAIERRIPEGQNYAGRYILRTTQSSGQYMRTNPSGTMFQVAAGLGGGAVVGGLGGYAVKQSAARYGVATAARAEKYLNLGGLGLGAGYVAMTPPETLGQQLPGFVAGGYGFTKGYRSIIKPPSTTYSGLSGTVSEQRFQGSTMSALGQGKVRATTTQYGVTSQQDLPVNFQYFGQRAPRGYFGRLDVGVAGGQQLASYNAVVSRGRLSAINPEEGLAFFSSTAAPQQGVSRTSSISLERNRYGVYGVTETGRGAAAADVNQYTVWSTRQYRATKNVRVPGGGRLRTTVTRDPLYRPDPRTAIYGSSVASSRAAGGANSRLFRSGFGQLKRAGYFENPKQFQEVFSNEVYGFGGRLGRSGSLRLGRSRGVQESILEPQSSRYQFRPQERPFTVEGLSFRSTVGYSRAPIAGFGFGSGQALASRFGFSQDSGARLRQGYNIDYSFRTPQGQDRVPRYDVTPRQVTDTQQSFRTSAFFPSSPPRAPPEYPPPLLPILPIALPFGASAPGGPAGRRGFQYNPDLTSSFLGITGKTPGVLGGLELRPLRSTRRRKRR
jgi:hypothetical protein